MSQKNTYSNRWYFLLWVLAVLAVSFLVLRFWPSISEAFSQLGFRSILYWMALTIALRVLLIEPLVVPIRHMGKSFSRREAFWLNWCRSLSNQILPFAGIGTLIGHLRARTGLNWNEIASLTSPQLVISAQAVCFFCGIVFFVNSIHGNLFFLIAGIMAMVGTIVPSLASRLQGLSHIIERLAPSKVQKDIAKMREMGLDCGSYLYLFAIHFCVICLRVLRLLVIVKALSLDIPFTGILVIGALAELSMFIQITPAALGIREALIMASSMVITIDFETALAISVIDRALMIGAVICFGLGGVIALHLESRGSLR